MEGQPLAGTRIVVTRASDQASSLSTALAELGAEVIEVPTIAITTASDGGAALANAMAEIHRYDWLVITSVNGAERVAASLGDRTGPDHPRPQVAAIGPGTADACAAQGLDVDLIPERFVAEGLLAVFPSPPTGGGRVLLAQAAGARPVLALGLSGAGWDVDVVEAYQTVNPPVDGDLADLAAGADIVTFTSASTVTGFVSALGTASAPSTVACIGPVTASAAREAGLDVDVVADPHNIAGLIAAIVDHVTRGQG